MAEQHAQRFTELSDRVSLTAAVDIEIERAASIAASIQGLYRAANDYRAILDDVDAVLIALPHHFHYPSAQSFLEADEHVLLERPMANRQDRCINLIDTAKRSGRAVAYL